MHRQETEFRGSFRKYAPTRVLFVADSCLSQKRRGKRLAPDSSDSNTVDDHMSKKLKADKEKDKEADKEKPLSELSYCLVSI